ncbi:MAG: hypothetical protein QM607_08865 [Microbacterium sp.]
MQLGTRWAAGITPPRAVPAALHAEIARLEAETDAAAQHASWTLTFLENHPIVELDLGYEVSVDKQGQVFSRPFDDWGD